MTPTIENQVGKLGYKPETYWGLVYEPVNAAMPDYQTPLPSKAGSYSAVSSYRIPWKIVH